jgi:hypothetical protein
MIEAKNAPLFDLAGKRVYVARQRRERAALRRSDGVEPAIGIGLKNPAIVGKMPRGMDAGPSSVARFGA